MSRREELLAVVYRYMVDAFDDGRAVGRRENANYADTLTRAAKALCEEYRKEFTHPKGWDLLDPIDTAYLALVAALAKNPKPSGQATSTQDSPGIDGPSSGPEGAGPWGGFCHRDTCHSVTKREECPGDLATCEGHSQVASQAPCSDYHLFVLGASTCSICGWDRGSKTGIK